MSDDKLPLEKIDAYRFRLPKGYKPGMRVDGIIYADEKLLPNIMSDKALEQVANVAFLPGIVKYSLAMPDIHWGYGMPIGGVAAFDAEAGGIISPGMIGYDINCGVRLVRTNLKYDDVKDKLKILIDQIFRDVPCGVGSKGEIRLDVKQEQKILVKGAEWVVSQGYGTREDLEHTEERGSIEGADPDAVSERAYERGRAQSGTLGSGNHFIEVQLVNEIYDKDIADCFNLDLNTITLMIHSGSRGLGYQICDDAIRIMRTAVEKYGIAVPDRQLSCAPLKSIEAEQYIAAMKCAANYAWANRQCLMHLVRQAFEKVFKRSWQALEMELIYDVAHNIAKFEKYNLNGKEKTLCVCRKGATRAFGPGHPDLPEDYKKTGQPVIIPGDMGRNSYLLVGTKKAEEETFSSTAHGAGRVKSRSEASRQIHFSQLISELKNKGIEVRAATKETVVEEAPQAYKDVNEVVAVVHGAGLSKKVCRMRPLAVVKG